MGYELKPFVLHPVLELWSVVFQIPFFLEQSDIVLTFCSGDRFASFFVTIKKKSLQNSLFACPSFARRIPGLGTCQLTDHVRNAGLWCAILGLRAKVRIPR